MGTATLRAAAATAPRCEQPHCAQRELLGQHLRCPAVSSVFQSVVQHADPLPPCVLCAPAAGRHPGPGPRRPGQSPAHQPVQPKLGAVGAQQVVPLCPLLQGRAGAGAGRQVGRPPHAGGRRRAPAGQRRTHAPSGPGPPVGAPRDSLPGTAPSAPWAQSRPPGSLLRTPAPPLAAPAALSWLLFATWPLLLACRAPCIKLQRDHDKRSGLCVFAVQLFLINIQEYK